MKSLASILALCFLSLNLLAQDALDGCSECENNCIAISFFGEHLPQEEISIWTSKEFLDGSSSADVAYIDPKEIKTDTVYAFCLVDNCYTIQLQGITPAQGDLPSGIFLCTNGDTITSAESTHYFFDSWSETITFSFDKGSYLAHCNLGFNSSDEDVTGDGVVNMEDVLRVLENMDEDSNSASLEKLILSDLDMINFNQETVMLKEPINYWILTSDGKIVVNRRSNQVDLSSLATGVYIFLTEDEARKFIVN